MHVGNLAIKEGMILSHPPSLVSFLFSFSPLIRRVLPFLMIFRGCKIIRVIIKDLWIWIIEVFRIDTYYGVVNFKNLMRIFSLPMMLIFLEIFIKKHLSQVCKLYVKFEIRN